ncbi:MAG: hypothetical protein NZ750_14285 [Anaerolineae bacterium]|nr:hypothetical protein [Anaerolineae bacterium]MDW8173771.1 hypothetical protein [Anaerolineae bacterium]
MAQSEASPPEPISSAQARTAIQAAILARLGEGWDDERSGWLVVYRSDWLVRLNRGSINLDFQCDLLGEVTVTERPANPLQLSGRLVAWMVLGASLLVALTIAYVVGALR